MKNENEQYSVSFLEMLADNVVQSTLILFGLYLQDRCNQARGFSVEKPKRRWRLGSVARVLLSGLAALFLLAVVVLLVLILVPFN